MSAWVRGKALQTVIALREIRPGDEIQMRLCANEDHRALADADFVRESYLVVRNIDNHDRWPVDLTTPDGPYSTCWCGIKAWRRPHG